MIRIDAEPGFVRLLDGEQPLGQATYAVTSGTEGLVQLVSLEVNADYRRRGFGRRLLHGLYDAARHDLADVPLRRAWVATGNKVHVVARSFFTGDGYHHVGSNGGVYRDQDLLIYVKSFD